MHALIHVQFNVVFSKVGKNVMKFVMKAQHIIQSLPSHTGTANRVEEFHCRMQQRDNAHRDNDR